MTNSQDTQGNQLRIRVFGGKNHGDIIVLDPSKLTSAVLGRTADCGIQIDDRNLSTKHCTFEYALSRQGQWTLSDGHRTDTVQRSRNGTWLYMAKEWPIYSNMRFRVANTLFQATTSNCAC